MGSEAPKVALQNAGAGIEWPRGPRGGYEFAKAYAFTSAEFEFDRADYIGVVLGITLTDGEARNGSRRTPFLLTPELAAELHQALGVHLENLKQAAPREPDAE